jgi:hypothetical protein
MSQHSGPSMRLSQRAAEQMKCCSAYSAAYALWVGEDGKGNGRYGLGVVGGCCLAEMRRLKKDSVTMRKQGGWQEGWPWTADCC